MDCQSHIPHIKPPCLQVCRQVWHFVVNLSVCIVNNWVICEPGKFGLKKGTRGASPPTPPGGHSHLFYHLFYIQASLSFKGASFSHLHYPLPSFTTSVYPRGGAYRFTSRESAGLMSFSSYTWYQAANGSGKRSHIHCRTRLQLVAGRKEGRNLNGMRPVRGLISITLFLHLV